VEGCAADRADEERCGERLAACLDTGLEAAFAADLEAAFAADLEAGFAADLEAVARGAREAREVRSERDADGRAAAEARAGAGAEARAEARGGAAARDGAAARADTRGAPPERSEDGRPVPLLLESLPCVDVFGRALRAAGVTAVGVMVSSDLQLAGGAQVRGSRSWV
jgi:hypothetical protein